MKGGVQAAMCMGIGVASTFAVAWLAAIVWPRVLSTGTSRWQVYVLDDVTFVDAPAGGRAWAGECRDFKAACAPGGCLVDVTRNTIGARLAPGAAERVEDVIASDASLRLRTLDRGPGWLRSLEPTDDAPIRAVLAGWPFHALGGWSSPVEQHAVWRVAGSTLPLRPLWPGLIAHSLLAGGLAYLIMHAAHKRRRTTP